MSSRQQSAEFNSSAKGKTEKQSAMKHHGLVSILATAAVLVVAVFVVYTIISDSIQIQDNMQKYNELVSQADSVQAENDQISAYLENDEALDEYIEDVARDKLDFANPDERIYYVVPALNE